MDETDGRLYVRFLEENDCEALGVLYEKFKDKLTLFLYDIVHDHDDAEELMMETFSVLASGSARYVETGDASFKTWLYAIAKNQARLFLRKKSRYSISDDDNIEEIADINGYPETFLLDSERSRLMYQAMAKLAPDYRQVLYLLYFEELKPEQISSIMGKNIKQIYNLATRGRAALKAVLEKMGDTWSCF